MNKKLITYFLIFLIIDLLFFLPVLINKNIIGSVDAYQQFYPYILHLYEGLKEGKIPFWWHYTALGYPFVSVAQSGALYPLNYLYILIPPPLGYNIMLIFHFFLLQIFSFLYIRHLLKKDLLAFLGAILFSFNIANLSRLDIYSFICASPYFIASLYIFHKSIYDNNLNSKITFYIILLALFLGLEFLSGYPQMFVYNITFLSLYLLLAIIFEKNYKVGLILVGSLIFLIPLIFIQFSATLSIIDSSLRAKIKDFFYNQFSYHPSLLLTYLFPYVFGGLGNAEYWGPEKEYKGFWREFINYISIFTIPSSILATYLIMKQKNKQLYYILLLAIVSFLLSLGKYTLLSYILYFVPGYSELRVPARNLFVFNFAIAVLSSLGIFYVIKCLNLSKSKIIPFLKIYIFPVILFTLPFVIYFWLTNKLGNLILVLKTDKLLVIYFLVIFFISCFVIYKFSNRVALAIILLAILSVIDKTFLFFSNPYFNMNIKELSDYDKMTKNFSINNHLENHFLILDEEIPQNLFALTTKQRVLNIYDPFVNMDYYYLFNIDWSGRIGSIYPLLLPRNNLILSIFGVNLLTESQPKFIKICENIYKEQNLTIIEIKDYQVFQNQESTIIYFLPKNKTDLIILSSYITTFPLNILQKIEKMIFENNEFIEINIHDMYSLRLYLDTIGNLKVEKDRINFLLPIILPSKNFNIERIKIEIKPFSNYRQIKIDNLSLYSYPFKRVLSIKEDLLNNKNLLSNRAYEILQNYPNSIVYKNLNSMPNVFGVENIKTVENIVEFKKMVLLSQFNPNKTAIIERKELEKIKEYLKYPEYSFLKKGKIEDINFGVPKIEKISFFEEPDKVELETECNLPALLVINNSFYKGWKCKINKIEIPVIKANGLVQAIIIPPGKHNITLEFNPWYKSFSFSTFLLCIFYIFLSIIISKN